MKKSLYIFFTFLFLLFIIFSFASPTLAVDPIVCSKDADCNSPLLECKIEIPRTTGTCVALGTTTAAPVASTNNNCQWRSERTETSPELPGSTVTGGCGDNEVKSNGSSCPGEAPKNSYGLGATTRYICCCAEKAVTSRKTPDLNPLGNLQVKIPGLDELAENHPLKCESDVDGVETCQIPWIAVYVTAIYNYLLGIGGILAAIALMVGGVIWLVSAGNASRVTEAKSWITGSVTGIVILLTSYVLLHQINPELIGMKYLELKTIEKVVLTPSEAVLTGQTKGMQCFIDTFGKTENEVKGQLVSIKFLGQNIRIHQKAKAAFEAVNTELTNINYKPSGTMGTFMWRENRNDPSQMSLHSFGIAIDFDPPNNPNYPKTCVKGICNGTKIKCSIKEDCICKTNIPKAVVDIFKKNGFRWGGDYKNNCDAMHFEWLSLCSK